MYQINYYNLPVYDDQLQELFPVLSAKLSLEVNDAGGLSFSIPAQHPNFGELKKLKMGITVLKNGDVIFKGRIIRDTQDFDNTRAIECEGKLASLNDTIYRPYSFAGSPTTYFTNLINNHNSQVEDEKKLIVGNITVTDPNDYITRSSINYNSTWELVKSLVSSLGGYLSVRYEDDGDYIDWLEDFPYTNTQKIEFAENLLDITQEVTAEETYTACIPLGAKIEIKTYGEVTEDEPEWQAETYYTKSGEVYTVVATETAFNAAITAGTTLYTVTSTESTDERVTVKSVNDDKDYIYNADKVAEYGWKFAPAEEVTWDDVTRPENLLTKATAYLNNTGVMLASTLELSAIDLAYTDAEVDSFEFCQYVQVVSVPHSLEKSYLLSKFDIDFLHPENTKIVLGDTQYTLYDSIHGQQQVVSDVVEKVEKIESDYATNEKVTNSITKELSTFSSQILQTSENITMGILAGYTTADDLEKYKQEVENTFNINEQGFAFQFAQMEEKLSELGNTVTTQNSYIRLENGEIIIGQTGENASPITTVYTNTGMEIRFNGVTVAKYTDGVMEINNAYIGNQLAFWKQFAFRKGAYITDVGYNLNLVWIGG